MNKKTILKLITTLAIAATISACNSPVDKILGQHKAFALPFINENGNFFVVNLKTGEIVPPCRERPTGNFDICKRPKGVPHTDEKTVTRKPHSGDTMQSGDNIEALASHTIVIENFPGSICQTLRNANTGKIYEVCF